MRIKDFITRTLTLIAMFLSVATSSATMCIGDVITVNLNGIDTYFTITGINPNTVQFGKNETSSGSVPSPFASTCTNNSIDIPVTVTASDGSSYAVTSLGPGCLYSSRFSSGTTLKSVSMPPTVISIGYSAFASNRGLESVEGLERVTTLGNAVFAGCQSLTTLDCLDNVETIGKSCFATCKLIQSLSFPKVQSISSQCFTNCYALTNIYLPEAIEIGDTAFQSCRALKKIELPKVKKIGMWFFYGCSALEEVILGSNVESIEKRAFLSTGAVKTIHISTVQPPVWLGTDAYLNASGNDIRSQITVYVPVGCAATYRAATFWNGFKEFVEEEPVGEEQTLALASLPAMTYGNAAYTLPATTAENLTLTWTSSNTSVATISGNTLTIKGAGTATITATNEGNNDYLPFSKQYTLTVAKAALTITADNKTKQQGEENPELTVTYSGFVYNEDASALTTQPTITTTATTDSPAGTYPITVSGAAAANYNITYVNGTLTVTEGPVIIEVTDISQLDNVIYINPMEAKAGEETIISFNMKNSAAIRGFQFDLYLPEGVTVVKSSKGKIQGSLSEGRLPDEDEHTLTFSEQPDGAIRFLCSSQYDETFTGNDGEIATLRVRTAESMADGDYAIQMKGMKLTETDISKFYETALITSKLTITSYISGDINGDGVVDVSDYTGVANHIHGNTPTGFIIKAADVDESGTIDVSDYTGIANIIHTGSIYGNNNPHNAKRNNLDPQ